MSTSKFKLRPLALLPLVATFAAGAPVVQAQEGARGGLEEVIVEARRKEENIQSVPVAVTALSQDTLDRSGAVSALSLPSRIPGFQTYAQIGNRNAVIASIRGQNYTYGVLFPAVVPYFAEMPITGGPQSPGVSQGVFFDLENVQVLRGPQGTLFGRVTNGGNMLIQPKKPDFDGVSGYGEFQAGDYDLKSFRGAVNIPVIDNVLAVRAAIETRERDGFTEDLQGGPAADDVDYKSGRLSILWRPTDRIENYSVVNYYAADQVGTGMVLSFLNDSMVRALYTGVLGGFVAPGALTAAVNGVVGTPGVRNQLLDTGSPFLNSLLNSTGTTPTLYSALARIQDCAPRCFDYGTHALPGGIFAHGTHFYRREDKYVVNQTTFEINDNLKIKNIFGYTRIKDKSGTDYDGTPQIIVDTPHSFIPYIWQEQWSDEIQLQGKSFGGRMDWVAGFYIDSQSPGGRTENYTSSFYLHRLDLQVLHTNSKAVFGQLGYDLSNWVEGLKFNLGMRQTWDSVSSDNMTLLDLIVVPIPHGVCQTYTSPVGFGTSVCSNLKETFDAFTYTTGFDWQVNPDMMVYVKAARGYRPGGYNSTSLGARTPSYSPEFVQEEEIGIKADWTIAGMQARTNIAWFYDDYTDVQKNQTFAVGGISASVIRNVAAATVTGIEFEGQLIPFDGLNVGLNYAFVTYDFANELTAAEFARACPADHAVNFPGADSSLFCPDNLLAATPEHQLSLDVHYTFPFLGLGDLTVGGNWAWQTEKGLNDTSWTTPRTIEPSYGLLNLDARLENLGGHPIDLSFFMTNVTDEVYRNGSNDLSNFGVIGTASDMYGEPRMWGFALKYKFGQN
ncbi:MAG: TonB-dependent receptor [Gammaproteobacteria bacterium]